jgi:predicted RNA-binding protein with PUA-like domain
MAYWLMKAEPGDYTFEQLQRDGEARWDGVHNHQAARNLRAMKTGDRVFFYRSVKDPAVVGVMEVVREAYEDADDPRESFALVDVGPLMPVKEEVTLKRIKDDPELQSLALVRQSRLSVSEVDPRSWRRICALAGIDA